MAIIQVKTIDPNFGYIIRKNPNSGMQLRGIRQGTAFAWYSNNNTAFNIFFKDADNAVSFGDQEFEYLNTSRYNSPMFVLNAMSEFFNSTVKEQTDIDIDGIEKSFFINMIDIKSLLQIKHFEKYFPDFVLDYQLHAAKSFNLTITTTKSFYMLFNYVNLFMLFITLTSDEYIQLDPEAVEKYLISIERLDAPFFIRYLFSRNVFKSKGQFNKYRARLENSKLYTSVSMEYGDTSIQRRNHIRGLLTFDKPILDVGCGEGFYAIPFSQNLNSDNRYYAIDIDDTLTKSIVNKARKHNINNISVFNNIDEFLKTYNGEIVDIILTEVIEHMPQEDSRKLLQKLLVNINFDKFIVTVPNQDFNKFYLIGDDEFRHDGHEWEPTEKEFVSFIEKEIPIIFDIDFINIGDTVNNISTSIGCVISNNT